MATNVINQDTQIIGSLELPVRLNDSGNFLTLNAFNIVSYRTPLEVLDDLFLSTFLDTTYIDFTPLGVEPVLNPIVAPPWKEGRFYYDEITHSYKFYNDTTSPITLAVTKLLVDKQFLDSFNESTGVFTSRQPVIEDINGLQEALEYTPRTYVHDQGTPSVLWSITHTLEKYPSVSVVDSAGSRVEGLVTYIDINNLTISFNAGFSGTAYLN